MKRLFSLLINQRYSIFCSLMVLLLLPQFSQAQIQEQIVTGTVKCGGGPCSAAEDAYVEWVTGTWEDGFERGFATVDARSAYELRVRTRWPRIKVRASAKGHLYSVPRVIQVGARVTHDVDLEPSRDRVSITIVDVFKADGKKVLDLSVKKINQHGWLAGNLLTDTAPIKYGFTREPFPRINILLPSPSSLRSINNLMDPIAVGDSGAGPSPVSFPPIIPLGGVNGSAHSINDSNITVGRISLPGGSQAAIHNPVTRRWDFITMPGLSLESTATGINNAGTVVGWWRDRRGDFKGFIKPGAGAAIELPSPPGSSGLDVNGINQRGYAYGRAVTPVVGMRAYWWHRTAPYTVRPFDLPPYGIPPAFGFINALDMNTQGDTVGFLINNLPNKRQYFPIKWESDGFITLLERLVPAGLPLKLATATSINDAGQIAGAFVHHRGYILSLLPLAKKAPMGALRPAGGAEGASNTVITYTGQPVYFDASESNDPDGKIVSYQWSFGDGEIIEEGGEYASHIYKEPGTYLAMVTVTDDEGYANTVTLNVQVRDSSGENTPPSAWAFLTPQRWPSSDVDTVWTEDWVALSGRYDDDGLPNDVIKAKWEVLDGPSDVEFSNVEDLNTQVRFKQAGKYVLQLLVDDGEYAVPSTPLVIEVTDRKPIN